MCTSVESRLESRLLELERRVRVQRIGLLACAAIGLLFACAAFAPGDKQDLTVARLTIVDGKGTPRIVIGSDRPGQQRISPSTGITIHDASGAERFGVGVMEDNRVNMGFDAPVGVGSPMRDRVAIGVGTDGSSYVMLIDNTTGVPVRMTTNATGGGGLEFLSYDKPNSKIIVKRHSFDGEKTEEHHHDFPKD